MGKSGTKAGKSKKANGSGKNNPGKVKLPKKECCVDKPRCGRCPLRALAEGTLPAGYTVRHRKLVKV
ncbi:hypothetical protein GIS00_05060 [Nakamurella sp. YIM 132087]|uniref:Uncharacterized protein n=1 Tax=Nakamurella alba TaxID=2665158 RepID=A0A7K1FGU2_9ACTN|nr:hypothetical protein [Nakamurella alba]MTD13318.1 hypothetical protein [Nakamurella alba]